MDSANVTCTTANLLSQMLTTKLFAMHLAMIGFRKLRVVWRSITLTYLDKYEYWKVKCVKSVLGEFSSGVSICHKKVLSQIWGPLFARPLRGALPPALVVAMACNRPIWARPEVPDAEVFCERMRRSKFSGTWVWSDILRFIRDGTCAFSEFLQ